MKLNKSHLVFLLAASSSISYVHALTWDPTNVPGAPVGGPGIWDASTTSNWSNGTSDSVWGNSPTAVAAFTGSLGGAVLVDAGGVSVNAFNFTNTVSYTFSGDPMTLVGTTPTITTSGTGNVRAQTVANATIANSVTGPSLNIAGTGVVNLSNAAISGALTVGNTSGLILTGTNTAGSVAVGSNVLTIGSNTALASGTAIAAGSGSFILLANGVSTQANLTISGGGTNLQFGNAADWQGSITQTAASDITVNGNATGTTISGNISLAGARLFFRNDQGVSPSALFNTTVSGTGTINVTGNISGPCTVNTGTTNNTTHLTLSGANTYTGVTTAGNGSLTINSINNVGSASSAIGAPTTVAAGTINLGSGATSGTLKYIGTGDTTDRVINLNGAAGGAILDQSGTGLLQFTSSAFTATGAGIKSLTLQGSTAGTGEIAGAIVDNSGTNKTSVVKSGTGTWTLSGVSTYTGTTTINSGTLALTGSAALASPTITVASGAQFNVSGLTSGDYAVPAGQMITAGRTGTPAIDVSGSLTVNGGGMLNIAGSGASGTATIDGNLTLNGALLQFGHSGVVGDKVSLAGASRTLTLSGTNAVSGFYPPGSHTLIDGYSSVTGDATNLLYIATARGASGSFTVDASSVTLNVTAGTPMALTWSGATGGLWDVDNSQNWNFGTQRFYQFDTVTFPDSPANSTVTINGNVQPGSISFTNASTAYTVRGGASPVIAGTGALTKSGAATVTLWHPANTYSGGTTINAGTIVLNNAATVATGNYSPLGTGLISINAGGTLQVNPSNGGSNIYTFPNALRLNGGTLFQDDGISVFSGLTTVDAASSIKTQWTGKNLTLAGGLAGSANLTVSDQAAGQSGTVILGADGTYSGNLTVNNASGTNGAIQLNSANALQNASVTVNTTAATDGATNPRGLILGGAADTNFTIAGLSGTLSAAAIHNADDVNTRTLTINQGGTTSFSGSIGGTTANTQRLNLVKSGAGTLSLTGANTYTGNTTVSAGTLVMQTRNIGGGSGDVTVADGATLGLASTGASLFIEDLNLGTSGANTLAITNFTPEGLPVIDATLLTKNATTTISISGTLVSENPFPQISPLISYVLPPTGTGTFTLAPLPRGVDAELVDSGSSIDLQINSLDSLVWKGTAGNTWDINTTSNWKFGITDPATYLNNDNVLFDGSATNTTIDLTTSVVPASVTFNFDDPMAYTLGGTGAITGASGILKKGTGKLTVSNANSYDGVTSVNAGSLVIANTSALGSTVGGTTVADGATLELNDFSTGGENYSLDGSLLNNGVGASTVGGTVSMPFDAIIGGSGTLNLSGATNGAGLLTKTGSGTLVQLGADSHTGGTTISSGKLQIGNGTANGSIGTTGTVTVDPGTTLRFDQNGTSALAAVPWANITGTGTLEFKAGSTGTANRAWTAALGTGFTGKLQVEAGRVANGGAAGTGASTFGSTSQFVVKNGGQIGVWNGGTFEAGQSFFIEGPGWGEAGYDVTLRLANSTTTTLNGTITLTGDSSIGTGQTAAGVATFNGIIDGGFALSYGSSSLSLGTYVLNAANTYTGNTNVRFGTLRLANTNALQSSTLNHTAGTIQFDSSVVSNAFTLGGLMGSTGITLQNNAGSPAAITLTVGNNNANTSYSGVLAGSGALTKIGSGMQTLTGAHTYTGNTTVDAGTLQLSATGRLKFLLGGTSGTSNTLSGAGTATLDGGFSIDTTAADSLTSGTWNLDTMGATSTYGSGFKVYQANGTTAWTDAGNDKWTQTGAAGRTWTFDEATGTLTLATAGFESWAAQIPNVADRIRTADPDGDGLTNLQEFLFGKNPIVGDGTLVSSTVSGSDLTLRWLRRENGASYLLKESTTLGSGSWTTSAITPQADLQPGDPADYDQWKAVIPLGSGKKFYRIESAENAP